MRYLTVTLERAGMQPVRHVENLPVKSPLGENLEHVVRVADTT